MCERAVARMLSSCQSLAPLSLLLGTACLLPSLSCQAVAERKHSYLGTPLQCTWAVTVWPNKQRSWPTKEAVPELDDHSPYELSTMASSSASYRIADCCVHAQEMQIALLRLLPCDCVTGFKFAWSHLFNIPCSHSHAAMSLLDQLVCC